MKLKTFLATGAGIIIAYATIFLVEMLGMNLFPSDEKFKPTNLEELKRLIENIPVMALMIIALGHGLAIFLAGVTVNKIEPNSIVGYLVIFLLLLFGTISNLYMIPHPIWFVVTDLAVFSAGALAGWKLLKWTN
jgi:hypothetical protein